MRAVRIAAVVSLVAFGAALALQGSEAAAGGKDKKTVRVHLMKLKVSETNAKGEAWDINNGKPDPLVTIKNLNDSSAKEFKTKTTNDVFDVDYGGLATVRAVEGDTLQISVFDSDVLKNDVIGTTKLTVTRDMITAGKHELKFEQVKSLTLEFRAP